MVNDDTKISYRNKSGRRSKMAIMWERMTKQQNDSDNAMAMMVEAMDPFQRF